MKAILLMVLFLSGMTVRAEDFKLQSGDLIFRKIAQVGLTVRLKL